MGSRGEGTRHKELQIPSPRRCIGKSAEVFDDKGVAALRCVQRVRKSLKEKKLDEHASFGRLGRAGRRDMLV